MAAIGASNAALAGRCAIVLGGYGLIGAACVRALRAAGFRVIGVGRSAATARRVLPDIEWRILDLAHATVDELKRMSQGADVIVNAAGALQDGLRDDVTAIHETMVGRLVSARAGTRTRIVQISAAGVSTTASTEFFRSKARGDRLLIESGLDHVILRPTLVLSRDAYGGTALLRASAALPLINFEVFPETRVQSVSIDDVTSAVVAAAHGQITSGTVADLTEPVSHSFAELVASMRAWLGLPPWRRRVRVPSALLTLTTKVADTLGAFGWRSPMRSTALSVLAEGIRGDPTSWEQAGGTPCRPLAATLASMPATAQDRWFARIYLVLPVVVATLAVFWIASGLVGLLRFDAATDVLTNRGFAPASAAAFVLAGSLADICVGLGICVRRFARAATFGMIALSLAYLAGATFFTPDLWADPLGPLVKVVPAITLALVAAALLDER